MTRATLNPETPETFRHQLLGFSTDDELTAVAGTFISDGIAAGEPVLCVASEATTRVLRDAVGETAAEWVRFIASVDWHQHPAWSLAGCGDFEAEQRGAARVRIVTDAGSQAAAAGAREWHRADAASNVVFGDLALSMLCLHDVRHVAAETMDQARRTHPQLLGVEGTSLSDNYTDPHSFLGECDREELVEPQHVARRVITAETLAHSRELIAEMALLLETPEGRAEDLALAVHEVATNAVEHGGGVAEQRVWTTDGSLVCEIRDQGAGFDDPFAGLHPPAPTAPRGRGMWLARQLCELVQIRSSTTGTTVRLHLHT